MMKNKLQFFKTNRLFSQQKNKKSSRPNQNLRNDSLTSPQLFSRKPCNPEQNDLGNQSLMDLQYLDISQYMATQCQDQRLAIVEAEESQRFLLSSPWHSPQIVHKTSLKTKNKQIFTQTKASHFMHQNKYQSRGRGKEEYFILTQINNRKKPLKKFSTRQLSENNCSFPFKLYNDYIVQDNNRQSQQLLPHKHELNPKSDQSPSFKNINLNEQINNIKRTEFKGPFLKKKFEYDRRKSYYLAKSLQCSQELKAQIKRSYNQKQYSQKEIDDKEDKILGVIDIKLDLNNETKVEDKKIRQIMQILQKKRIANVSNKLRADTLRSEGQKIKIKCNRKSKRKLNREVELFNMFSSNYQKLKKNRQHKYPHVKFNQMDSLKKNINSNQSLIS